MKIKAKWGFIGDAKKLGADTGVVKAGQTFDADDEYAHVLIGKGLVEQVGGKAKADESKEAKPATTQKAAPKSDKSARADESK